MFDPVHQARVLLGTIEVTYSLKDYDNPPTRRRNAIDLIAQGLLTAYQQGKTDMLNLQLSEAGFPPQPKTT